jgi:hypothetical protein
MGRHDMPKPCEEMKLNPVPHLTLIPIANLPNRRFKLSTFSLALRWRRVFETVT